MASVIVAGDVSGTCTLQAPSAAGSTVLTLPVIATDTLAGIAATQTLTNKTLTSPTITGATITVAATAAPAFSAYLGSAFSTASSVATKIPFNTENFDTASAFDSTTNYRFTPLVAGYYQINLSVNQGFVSATGLTNASIYKNGVEYTQGTRFANTTSAAQAGVNSALVYLNGSTDYIEFYAFQNSGSTQAATFNTGTVTQGTGAMVRSA